MISLFGWEFVRKEDKIPEPASFSPRDHDDGAAVIAATGVFGTFVDLDGTVRSESELVTRYRSMAEQGEIDAAIDEIVGEMIAGEYVVKVITDDVKQSTQVKAAIDECFEEIIEMLDFRHHGYDIAKRWYVDGRLYFHIIIDDAKTKDGIQEIRYIDPRKIRKVREVIKKQVRGSTAAVADAVLTQTKNEYFLYSDKGFYAGNRQMQMGGPTSTGTTGIKIAKDTVVHVTSGLTDAIGTLVLSYLHKAIKPFNQLRALEDAAIIYRLSRASERRIWYVDVGNLPKMKAEQYVKDLMTKQKNKLNYDATTGEITNDRKFITMLEDFWLPQRDGKGTKVDVLPPGTSFNQIDDILFFQKKLYMHLHVPIGRLDPEQMYNADVATGITRDEVKFGKFIDRMRTRFSQLFVKLLEKQLVLRQIMTIEDFQKVGPYLKFDFVKDNYFMEAKEQQILMMRSQLATMFMPFIGRYYSNDWMRRNLLKQSDEEIKEEDELIAEELMNPQFQQPMPGEEQEQDDPSNPAVIADQGAVQAPPNMVPPKNGQGGPEGQAKKDKKTDKKSNKQGVKFKNVASILAKGT